MTNSVEAQNVLEKLRQEMPYITSEYGVKRLAIFGSYARSTQISDSDIDIIVEFERPIGLQIY